MGRFHLALALACGCGLGSADPVDGLLALVQHTVSLHAPPERQAPAAVPASPAASTKFLVHNTDSKLKGRGVLYRTAMTLNSTAGQDRYEAWGATVEAIDKRGAWVKVGDLYLPKRLNGVQVLVPLEETKARWQSGYEPTEVRRPDGSWAPCNITGRGSKPDTYNIFVTPLMQQNATSGKTAVNYPLSNIPASMLKQVSPMKFRLRAPPGGPTMAPAWKTDGSVQLKVMEKHREHSINVLKKSPMQVLRRLVCGQAFIGPKDCDSHVFLLSKGKKVQPSEHVWELGLRDGDVLEMLVKP